MTNTTNLAKLLENDLEQAKLVIATQDVLDRLQKIAEHLAQLGAEEIMPLSDNMKAAFGPDIARDFENTADQAIQHALESVRSARDVIDGAILKVQGNMPGADMGSYEDGNDPELTGNDMADAQIDAEADQQEQNDDMSDDSILSGGDGFDGAEASASDEPLGRAQRESIENKKALVENIFRKSGKSIIMKESLGSLVSWILEDAAARLPQPEYDSFKNKIDIKLDSDPVALAGWIGFKKASVAGMAQHSKPVISPSAEQMGLKIESSWSADERKARGIAKVIEANITAYGHGRAASVVRQFTSTDLRENSEKTLIETFKNIYGKSPAEYSVLLKKQMMEDITSSPNPSPDEDGTDTGTTSTSTTTTSIKPATDMTNMQKANAAQGVAKLAASVGDNVANGQKPLSTAMNTLSGPEKQAVNDVVSNIDDQTGSEPDKVGELLGKASSVIGEEEGNDIHPELNAAYHKTVDSLSPDELKRLINVYVNRGEENHALVKIAKEKLSQLGN